MLLQRNEDAGLAAIQSVPREHAGRESPRALSIFFRNVAAARAGLRRLDQQPEPGITRLNFRDLPAGTRPARTSGHARVTRDGHDEDGESIADRPFEITARELRTRRPRVPTMLTLDGCVIRPVCLCYLMARIVMPRRGSSDRPERFGRCPAPREGTPVSSRSGITTCRVLLQSG